VLTNAVYRLAGGATNQLLRHEVHSLPDAFNRPTRVTQLDGTYTERDFGCCGLTETTDREGVLTEYFYDAALRPTATRRLGITHTNVLDVAGRVVARQRLGSDGSTNLLWLGLYDTAGFLTRETNALGGVTAYAESSVDGHRVRTTTFPDGGTRVETHHRGGDLWRLTGTAVQGREYTGTATSADRDGLATEYLYCEARTETVLDAGGDSTGEFTTTYTDGRGFTFRQEDAYYNARLWYYANGTGQLTWERDADGVTTRHTYNAQGEREYSGLDVNSSGTLTTASTDRLMFTTSYCTNVSSVDYHYTVTQEFPTDNSATALTTRERWQTLDGLQTWDVSFGLTNRSVTTINRGTYTRTVTRHAPDNSYVVDVFVSGRPSTSTRYDSASVQLGKTTYTYDHHGRRATATDARNGATVFAYNLADQVTGVTTPAPGTGEGAQTTWTDYNASGRAWKITQPDGAVVTNEFFPTGQLKKTFGSRTYPVEYTYDPAGRMATMKTWRNFTGNSGTATTAWTYDLRGALTRKTYEDDSHVDYTHTDGGRLKTRVWARGITTTYEYDFEDGGLGRAAGDLKVVSYDDGVTPSVTYGYDRRGRQTGVVRDGMTTTRTLHDAGVLLNEAYSGGILDTLSRTNTYDSLLRRTQQQAKKGSTGIYTPQYTYDNASRLKTVVHSTTGVTYDYETNSPLVQKLTFKESSVTKLTTTKSYDRLNRLQGIVNAPATNAVPALAHAYQYNAANQRVRSTLADGSFWQYDYDALGQVKSGKRYWADGTPVAGQQFEYGFDDIGNRTTAKSGGDQNGANLRSQSYAVDDLNLYTSRGNHRYLEVQGAARPTSTVQVDGSTSGVLRQGEYFRKELGPLSGTGALWQSLSVSLSGGTNTGTKYLFLPPQTESYTHDADGNLTQDGRWDYTWDGENRLVQMKTRSGVAGPPRRLEFDYDAQGRRIRKRVYDALTGGTLLLTRHYLYDGWNLLVETDSGNNAKLYYLWGLDLSGSMEGAGGVGGLLRVRENLGGTNYAHYAVAHDGNGNVAGLLELSGGTWHANYEYGPFGETTRLSGPFARTNPFRFSTKFQDDESELLYYGYRYYNPGTGRWLNRDPIEERGGKNMLVFLSNSTTGSIDKLGLKCLPPEVLAAIAAATVAGKTGGEAGAAGGPLVAAVAAVGGVAGALIAADLSLASEISDINSENAKEAQRLAEEEQKLAERKAYHKICDESAPPNLDKCNLLMWRIIQQSRCIAARKEYIQKWNDTYPPHLSQVSERLRARDSLIKEYLKDPDCCKSCPWPASSLSP